MDSTSSAKENLVVQNDFANDKELSDDFVKRLRYYGEVTAESADTPTKQLMRKAAVVIEALLARSFKDVIEVQRREVMLDPSNAYMVGLHNGMAMMEANYHSSVDWECLPVVAENDLTLEQQNYRKALNVEVQPVKQAECTSSDTGKQVSPHCKNV